MEWLSEHFEIIWRATRHGRAARSRSRATYARVDDLTNSPRAARAPGVKLLIGGHGKNYTLRLAARYCDELNLNVFPDQVPELLEVFARALRRDRARPGDGRAQLRAPTRSCATRT